MWSVKLLQIDDVLLLRILVGRLQSEYMRGEGRPPGALACTRTQYGSSDLSTDAQVTDERVHSHLMEDRIEDETICGQIALIHTVSQAKRRVYVGRGAHRDELGHGSAS